MSRRAVAVDGEFKSRAADGKLYIEGYFAVFGAKYHLWDNAYETIDRGAFDLDADVDVRALTNHDTTLVLGRTTNGTLTLKVDDHGLWGSIVVNENDQDAVNAHARVERGDVSQCSFGFDILDEELIREDGNDVWHIRKVKLYEVSICTFPAYEDTEVKTRQNEMENIKKRKAEAWRTEMLKKLKGAKDA